MADRFPPPWTVQANPNCYWIEAANGARVAFVYFRNTESIGSQGDMMSQDSARRIACNIAKLPELIAGAKLWAGEPERPHWTYRIGPT